QHRQARRRAAVAPGQHPQQHRQRHAGDALDPAVREELGHHVAGRGAEDVGENEHAVAGVDLVHHLARAQQQVVGIVLAPHAERGDLARALAEDLRSALEKRRADLAVGDDEEADHESLDSSASMNMPDTSKPLWSWISRKQVGLVTLISVSQSPITSRPTSSSRRAASFGPSAAAISRCLAPIGCATPRAPAARLPRDSPVFGMRARQWGTALPSISSTRLSPWAISGM